MKRFSVIFFVFFYFSTCSFAQMWNGIDSLFGNEWIQYDQQYFKMLIAEDGLYRVNKQTLEDAGVPINTLVGAQLRLYSMGTETPIYVSNTGTFGNTDYLEFYGKKNRSELDYHVFANPEEDLLNPRYSLYNDASAYFLTWNTDSATEKFVETPNNLTNLPPKETAYVEELELILNSHYSKEYGSQTVRNSYFETAEGFGSQYKKTQNYTLTPTSFANNGIAANLHVRYATDYGGGANNGNGEHNQSIKINDVEVAVDETFRFNVLTHDFSIANTDLANPINISFEGTVGNLDKQSVANLELTYPRLFDFANANFKSFRIGNSTTVKYLEIENFNTNGVHVLYDLTNKIRITPTVESGILKIALPPSATERELVLVTTDGGVQSISALQPITFTNFLDHQSDYFIVSHPTLMQPDNQGINRVGEYADYRASSVGGNYIPLIIDINQLYDQFAYGVARHPISVRNFANKLRQIENLPEYFFLIGKGREYQSYRKAAQISNPDDLPLLVPSFGNPCSDRMLLSNNTKATPVTAIGRLPASTTEDIRIYLNKVREYEGNINNPSTIEDRAWMKRIIHLGGGSSLSEQNLIRNHLIAMENIIETNKFGADVRPFYRTNTNAVEVSTNEQIFENINKGVAMLTFFGHAGANSFDYNIDNFDNFSNKGKYPIMFALGCSIGNVHTSFKAVGERFVFGHEDKGMIAFVASSSFGFITSLRSQMQKTYELMGTDMYGETIGNIMRETTRNFDTHSNILTQQNTLNGDPALRFHPFEKPDVVVDAATVKFNPSNIHTDLNTYDFSFDVVNIGKGVEDSMTLRVDQRLPDGSLKTPITARIATPLNRSTHNYSIPTYGKPSVGLNKMLVTLDTNNEVEEAPSPAAEMNNELKSSLGDLGIPFFIQDNGIEAVYPSEFAIVNETAVTLIASTSNALASERKYIMQIDTTEDFNSPFLQQQESIQIGGLFKWQPTVQLENEQVYYWRVSPDSTSALTGFVWDESSFVYLEEYEEGWNQSDFGQWERDEFEGGIKLTNEEEFSFIKEATDIRVENRVWSSQNPPEFNFNGNNFNSPWPWLTHEGVEMIVMDSNTPNWWLVTENDQFGSVSNANTDPWIFNTNTIEDRENLMNFIENEIPDNYFVILFTLQRFETSDFQPEDWAQDSVQLGKNLFSVLEEMGAEKVRMLEESGSVPYVFMFKKGGGALGEDIATSISDDAIVQNPFFRPINQGSFNSLMVGPASEWSSFYWDIKEIELPENDSTSLSIYGINDSQTQETLLFENILTNELDLSNINAIDYPFLKLRFFCIDELNHTTAQLDYWRVTYRGITELAVNPNAEFEFYRDTLQEGEPFKIKYAIENISNYDADSLLIRYLVTDEENEAFMQVERIPPLEKGEMTVAEFNMNTKGLRNIQNILVEINPDKDQKELLHINNFINSKFFVEYDKRNPVLDVTFDGIHIMDGDLVSPNPIISINLKDENKYLELADTSLFKLSLQYPDESEVRNISFGDESVSFFPAILNQGDSKNEARIEYSPILLVDGIYTLMVEARDATGNISGDLKYAIKFEVINKNMISSILNYPNPFSTSTRFVYTLTGNEPPAFFKIQIMTVSGRIIREITQDEIGPMRTGTHTTDYAWDGTDEFGDKLANGIYLYRVTAQKNDGTEFETIETGADTFIKKGFGKMVLIR